MLHFSSPVRKDSTSCCIILVVGVGVVIHFSVSVHKYCFQEIILFKPFRDLVHTWPVNWHQLFGLGSNVLKVHNKAQHIKIHKTKYNKWKAGIFICLRKMSLTKLKE